jgi:hypothetical protein
MFLKNKFMLIVLLISALLAGCARQIPDVGIPSEYLNRYLEIKPYPGVNKFGFNEIVDLVLTARTDVEVKINFDTTRVFMFDEESSKWREIRDKDFISTGIFSDGLLLEHSSKPPDIILSQHCVSSPCQESQIFSVIPDVQDSGQSVDILVVVSGFVYENGIKTNQKTGAYVIFTLTP